VSIDLYERDQWKVKCYKLESQLAAAQKEIEKLRANIETARLEVRIGYQNATSSLREEVEGLSKDRWRLERQLAVAIEVLKRCRLEETIARIAALEKDSP
jgi:predicted  nucleic acid-binding Zn-ribbon protein